MTAYEGTTYDMEWTILLDWIDELESGRHEQCRQRLHYNMAHCCLGVERYAEGLKPGQGFEQYPDDQLGSQSPSMSLELAIECMILNDKSGWDFDQIASWLRDNVRPVPEFIPGISR